MHVSNFVVTLFPFNRAISLSGKTILCNLQSSFQNFLRKVTARVQTPRTRDISLSLPAQYINPLSENPGSAPARQDQKTEGAVLRPPCTEQNKKMAKDCYRGDFEIAASRSGS